MALFIGGLALQGELLDAAKVGVMAGSTLSAVVGMALIFGLQRKTSANVAGATDSSTER
jgi:NhaA family Na+:H+ antiporter